MERRRRIYIHKGKVRYKKRMPRKKKKQWKKSINDYINILKEKYGDDWADHIKTG